MQPNKTTLDAAVTKDDVMRKLYNIRQDN